MIQKKPILSHRLRAIRGSFAFIEHRFLRDGFFVRLSHHELLLYLFLVLVSDRHGLSCYGEANLSAHLHIGPDECAKAREALVAKDLIAFDGRQYQVLSLPERPRADDRASRRCAEGPESVGGILARMIGGKAC